jgi:CO/xanthine dehydrogenase FAD-binding subunit
VERHAGISISVSPPLYFDPSTVKEAVGLLSEHRDARPVAGGTDLVVAARNGRQQLPDVLVALHKISELRGIRAENGQLRLGALVTHQQIADSGDVIQSWTSLADASLLVGSPATRATGTIGGNVMNASPAMELGAPLLVHGARVRLVSSAAERLLPVVRLWKGPGRTSADSTELLTEVVVPRPEPGSGGAYVRLEYREAMEIAVVGAAASVVVDAARIVDAAVALTAVAPTCVLVEGIGGFLRGTSADSAPIELAAELAARQATPISDVRASAAYRTAQVRVIAARALRIALRRALGETVGVPANRSVDRVK